MPDDGTVHSDDRGALAGLESASIVMVDDEPTTLEVLEMFLRAEGYRDLVKVSEPRKALECIAAAQPDLVLLNLIMPQVTGLDVLAGMHADPSLRSVPVLVVTGTGDAELKNRAVQAGAADFLAKPVDPSELALRVRNLLAMAMPHEGPGAGHSSPAAARTPDRERLRFIVDTFLDRLRSRLDEMERCVAYADFTTLGEHAHWLKGAAGTVGIHDLTEPAEELGRLARARDALPLGPLLGQIRARAAALAKEQGVGR